MEHIIIEQLDNSLLRLTAEEGYVLHNDFTGLNHSEAIIKTTDGWRAVLSGIDPQPHERTVEDAKKEKLAALKNYDSSAAVNSFSLSGQSMWISPEDRANYILTLQGAKRLGVNYVSFLGQTIPVDNALAMLDAVNLYAMQCVGVTDLHRNNINSFQTIEEIDGYNFTINYPQKLIF